MLQLTALDMKNRLKIYEKSLESSKTFCLKIKNKTLISVLEASRVQEFVLKDNINESWNYFLKIRRIPCQADICQPRYEDDTPNN